jgi:hypothetical protein
VSSKYTTEKVKDIFSEQGCELLSDELKRARGDILHAHHIQIYSGCEDLRFKESNGITFCKPCHIEFHSKYSNSKNTQAQVDEYLQLSAVLHSFS